MGTNRATPDRILVNGQIMTVDADFSCVEAVAIRDRRFVASGTTDEMRALAGPETVVDDLGGAFVIPGLIDAHNHLLATSRLLQEIMLYDCRSIDEILDRVAARVQTAPPGAWILGRGWDESLLAEHRYPTRWELDRVAPNNPVVLHRVWNKLVANSAALAAAGVTRETPDPPADLAYAGSFDRDPDSGEPTGLFRDRAKDLILHAIPQPTVAERASALAAGCQAHNAVGLVGVADPGIYDEDVAAYRAARDAGTLTVRTHMLLAGWGFGSAAREAELKDWITEIHAAPDPADDRLRIDGVKFMIDGGIGDRTARMDEPYLDEPDNFGQWVVDPEEYPHLVRWVHDLGYSIDTHTCGSAAQALAIDAYAAALEAAPNPAVHHRIHHAYYPQPEGLELMARYRIPALVSNPFLVHLGESFVTSVGPERAAQAMPMATYLRAGVPLAGSSDSPVAVYNPFEGIYAAITRRTVAGRVLDATECISREDALRSYTIWAAAATGDAATRGSIEPGKLADLVVLDRDLLSIPEEDIRETRVVRTMVDGEWVWEQST